MKLALLLIATMILACLTIGAVIILLDYFSQGN